MTNKTSLLALIVAVAALIVAYMHTSNSVASGEKRETVFDHVMKTRTIRCGYALWNPVLYKDAKTGEIKGITHDIVEAIGKKLDMRIEWTEETGWGTVVEGLATHRYDMICNGLGTLAHRAQVIGFSNVIFYDPEYLIVRKDETRLHHMDDVNNEAFRVVVLDGEGFSLAAPNLFPKAKIYSLPQNADWSLIVQEVVANKADTTGLDYATYYRYNKSNPDKIRLINETEPFQVYPMAFGLPQGDVEMKTLVDSALSELQTDGTIARAVRAYTESPNEFPLPAQPYASSAPQP